MTGNDRDFVGYGPRPPDPDWPGGIDVAVNIVVNYEEGAEYALTDDGINDSWGEYTFQFGPQIRDFGTESHYEFGSRVGVWRLARIFDDLDVPVTFNTCARALERNPPLAAWMRERGHDVLGHGYRWYGPDAGPAQDRDSERAEIERAVLSLRETTGQDVLGWMVRSFRTPWTRELLIEHGGFLYDSDATNDELPYYVPVGGRPHLVVPYTKVFNDTRYLINPTYASPRHFTENLLMGLEYLLEEAEAGAGGRMFSVGVHPRWSGQPNRARAVRDFVEHVRNEPRAGFMRRADIARHWLSRHPPAGGG